MTSATPRRRFEELGPLCLGCTGCEHRLTCGGQYLPDRGVAFSCGDACRRGDCGPNCSLVSPAHPDAYARALVSVNGFGTQDLELIRGPRPDDLPLYLGVIEHGAYTRDLPPPWPWMGIPLRAVVSFPTTRGRWTETYRDGDELRADLGVASGTKLMLSCIHKDDEIEPVWEYLLTDGFLEYFKKLRLDAVIAPNFSWFDHEPRHHHWFNRKRSLIVAELFTRSRIPIVPYFHALQPSDVVFWRDFLSDRPEINIICEEFQTGLLSDRTRALTILDELAGLQSDLGRGLHLVAVGAMRLREEIARRFDSHTIVSSHAFVASTSGQCMVPRGKSFAEFSDGRGARALLLHNHHVEQLACQQARNRARDQHSVGPHEPRGSQLSIFRRLKGSLGRTPTTGRDGHLRTSPVDPQ